MILQKELLKEIEALLRDERITPAKRVDEDSLVCLRLDTQIPGVYQYQHHYLAQLPPTLGAHLYEKKVGDTVGTCNIVGIFDVWDIESPKVEEAIRKVFKH